MELLTAVADTLVPGVRIGDDDALSAALAPVARAAGTRRPEPLAAWNRSEREAFVSDLLAAGGTAAEALRRVLRVAARTHYGAERSWQELGFRPLPPGREWPRHQDVAAAVADDAPRASTT